MNQPSVSMHRRTPRKIRYHDHEWETIVAQARACDLPPATFVRQASLGVKPRARRTRTENELILELGRIATELQNLMRLTAESRNATAPSEIKLILDEVFAAVRRIGSS